MVAAVLDRPTLVLNRNWQPVGVATVARSLTKVWNDTARIVDPADYQQYTWADRTPQQARMTLRKQPSRPLWKPLYGSHGMRIDSWSRFVSEAYWNVELEK